MERHPTLQFVFTEQGTAWIPEELTRLDYYRGRLSGAGGADGLAGGEVRRRRHRAAVAVAVGVLGAASATSGSSFIRRHEVGAARRRSASTGSCGAATSPTSRVAGRTPASTCGWPSPACPRTRCGRWSGGNAADVYGFDWPLLEPLADRHGPTAGRGRRAARRRGHPRRVAALPGVRRRPLPRQVAALAG